MSFDDALEALRAAGDALAFATLREMQLEDERALVKDAGIRRLVETRTERSATAAEKVIERDDAYMAHRHLQYEAVVARITAATAYEIALAAVRAIAHRREV